ncbi:MAG: NAD(P)/FAD-dependent oxidoreductase [Gammaproteobacteria bacterium]|nr:NAD(P)/FAD-dependent oxidoreductase [Gammaproteobacteria bacterium]
MLPKRCDAVVVGAGFGGLIMTLRLRELGLDVVGLERGGDFGGTWYWNRYPGCRCDVESMEYSYQFSKELEQEWQWPERYSAQPEILAYAQHVADRFDVRRLFHFNREVVSAVFDSTDSTWTVGTREGEALTCSYLIMATGCLSAANIPAFAGLNDYKGRTYHTGAWPHGGVDFTGQRVAVIGTGSSAIQSIPIIARQAKSLHVFQRTANYSIPAQNAPLPEETAAAIKANYGELRERNWNQPAAFGAYYERNPDSVLTATPEERKARFERYWVMGGFMFLGAFGDLVMNVDANAHAAEFVRSKIRETVKDPGTAELLCPKGIIACKRLCADTGYFETYNLPHVKLVDVSQKPIERLNPTGLETGGNHYEFDAIVFATGFDAMTGALLRMGIVGEGGLTLKDKWSAGPRTWLGVTTSGFPNLWMMTGPGSPSVLANMITGVEHHADFISRQIEWLRKQGHTRIEADVAAEDQWVDTLNQRASLTLYPHCNSWYLGANVPGKPRVFMPYLGWPDYVQRLRQIEADDYTGFKVA